MNYREKSAAAALVATLLGLGVYLVLVRGATHPLAIVPAVIGMAVLMTVILIIAHIVMAALRQTDSGDERDTAIVLRASHNAYLVLAIGAWGIIGLALTGASLLMIANAAMIGFTLSEIVRYGSRLFYYRRGI